MEHLSPGVSLSVVQAERADRIARPERSEALWLKPFPGLGDVLLTLAVAYGVTESGVRVGVRPEQYAGGSVYDVSDLPHLPLLGSPEEGARCLSLSQTPAYNWQEDPAILDRCLDFCRAWHVSTPRTACLLPVPSPMAGPYTVICASAHSRMDAKRLLPDQVQEACEAALSLGSVPVLVGDKPEQVPAGAVSLAGETSIRELCGLVCHAEAVFSTDSGPLHLAAAYQVPVVGVFPQVHLSRSTLADYCGVWLCGRKEAAEVPPDSIGAAVRAVLLAARQPWQVIGSGAWPCGLEGDARRIHRAMGLGYWPEHPAVREWLPGHRAPSENEVVVSAHALPADLRDLPRSGRHYICRTAGTLARLRAARIPCLYAPIPTAEVQPDPLPERPLTVCWHGMVQERKSLDRLLAAWPKVRSGIPGSRLLLVGSERRPPLWCYGEGVEVRYRDVWSEEALCAELKDADLFCYPDSGNKEQSGASAYALAFGRPVVVSRSSAHDQVRAWGVTEGSDLAGTICRLLADRAAYRGAAQRALQGASYRTPALVGRTYRAALVRQLLTAQGLPTL